MDRAGYAPSWSIRETFTASTNCTNLATGGHKSRLSIINIIDFFIKQIVIDAGENMSFKSQHPNYQGYESLDFCIAKIPKGFSSALQGFISRHCRGVGELKVVINDIAGRVPMELTTNWGWDFLINDLPYYVDSLCKQPFHKVMDFLGGICSYGHLSFKASDVNELFEDLEIGYVVEVEPWSDSVQWVLRDSVTSRTESVEAAAIQVKDICEQTLDHLTQAIEHLRNTKNDRDRKDAIRDCLSAMESMLKTLSGKADIKDATTELRSQKTWGPDLIVKDGLTLWDRMHDLYPDIRHGNPTKSVLTDDEAIYWLDRITCFIRYMSRVHNG